MAGLITIVAWPETVTAIFTNVHALQEIGPITKYRERLVIWKDLYFAALDPTSEKEKLGLIWAVPTIQLINRMLENSNTFDVSDMDGIINLVQNSVWAIAFFPLSAAAQAGIVTAFNSAWT